jgi:hypothetical protein
MPLLLTILSVLAVWALLGVLTMGLFLIRKALQDVRIYMEKIAMGVRAIEQQTKFTSKRTEEADAAFKETAKAFSGMAEKFAVLKGQDMEI